MNKWMYSSTIIELGTRPGGGGDLIHVLAALQQEKGPRYHSQGWVVFIVSANAVK
jgi:hypothetical protein